MRTELDATRHHPIKRGSAVQMGALAAILVAVLGSAGLARGAIPAKTTTEKAAIAPTNQVQTLAGLVRTYDRVAAFSGSSNQYLPKTLKGGLHLGRVEVVIPSSKNGIHHPGFVDYGRVGGAEIVAASDGPRRDRFGIVIDKPLFMNTYTVGVRLPVGAIVNNEASGAIIISSPTGGTTLAPARAVDARGHLVPARYRITNEKLVITIQDKNASFPVMIDPVSSSYWWGTQTWYSRGDVRNYASWYGVVGVAAAACNEMGPLAGLCRAVVGRYASWISGTWMYAKNTNQCLTMRMTWTGQVIGVNAYGCNWG